MVEELQMRYRKKHPKCDFCKYCTYKICPQIGLDVGGYHYCKVTNKFIRFINLPRLFCRYYSVKDRYEEVYENWSIPCPPVKQNKKENV